jgi:hypothetical protein
MARKKIGLRPALAVGAAIVILAVLATTAFAVDSVITYTGCLNTSGSGAGNVSKVKAGDNPLSQCSSGQTQIRLSSGDITSVTAGSGLTGGGTNGAVTLGLSGGYTLPQDCSSGQVAKSDGSNAWACGNDNDTTYSAGTGLSLSGNEFSLAPAYRTEVWRAYKGGTEPAAAPSQTEVVSLDLPAGAYLVNVTGNFETADHDLIDVNCVLTDGFNNPTVGAKVKGDSVGTGVPFALQDVASLSSSGSVSFYCSSYADAQDVNGVLMTATRVGAVHSQ